MEDIASSLNNILNDPNAMQQIMQLAAAVSYTHLSLAFKTGEVITAVPHIVNLIYIVNYFTVKFKIYNAYPIF